MTNQYTDRILVIDDDSELTATVSEILNDNGWSAHSINNAEDLEQILQLSIFDAAIVDLRMPSRDGQSVLRCIKKHDPAIALVMLTGYGTVEDVVTAFHTGAVDFLTKPVTTVKLISAVRRALATTQHVRSARVQLRSSVRDAFDTIIGNNEHLLRQIDEARLAAKHDEPVLILGETGTGKDLMASAIHNESERRSKPFLTTVVGARPETIVNSELFGHVKDAYTGASQSSQGIIRSAHGGTLFLDEIADTSKDTQVALLRAVESKKVQPIGASHEIHADVRFIAAANRDLQNEIDEKRFRSDLYYRLSQFVIQLPSLRERVDDIAGLAMHFAMQATAEGAVQPVLTDGAIQKLTEYDWPGNIRELRAEVSRSVYRCQGKSISSDDILIGNHRKKSQIGMSQPLRKAEEQFRTRYLAYWFRKSGGNIDEISSQAEVHPQTIRKWLKAFGIR